MLALKYFFWGGGVVADKWLAKNFRRKKTSHKTGFFNVADTAGFEPATAWFVARYSIQLSYASAINCFFISHA
jgi:hypothetical protein